MPFVGHRSDGPGGSFMGSARKRQRSAAVGYGVPAQAGPAFAFLLARALCVAAPCAFSIGCVATDESPGIDDVCTAGQCEINLERVATLSDSTDPGILPDQILHVQRDAAGRLITIDRTATRIVVFDAGGRLLASEGGRGEGPGEFNVIRRAFVGPGDSIHAIDRALRRAVVFTPDLASSRTTHLEQVPDFQMQSGQYVLAGQIPTAEHIGYPVHVLSTSGRILQSLGVDTPQYRRDLALWTSRHVAPSSDGMLWTVAPGRYVIEKWDPASASRRLRIDMRPTWFSDISALNYDERVRPEVLIRGLWEDSTGFVWVLIRDADENWQIPTRANIERVITAEEYSRMYDWVIEVLNPASGELISRARFDNPLWYRPPTRLLVSPRIIESQYVEFDVFEPTLRRMENGG
jgi:hypothetical protein